MGSSALSGGVVTGWGEFGDLYRGEAPRLAVFAMALGANPNRAADLAQESLAALWRRWDDVPGAARTFARILMVRASRYPEAQAPEKEIPEPVTPDTETSNTEISNTATPNTAIPEPRAAADASQADASQADAPGFASPLRFPAVPHDDGVLTGLAALAPRERQVLVASFDDLPPEDVAQVLQMPVDLVGPTADSARVDLTDRLDGNPARPAYEALVAAVAAAMDLEGGLALIAATTDAAPDTATVDSTVDATVDATAEPDAVPPAEPSRRSSVHIPDELVAAAMTGDRDAVARLLEVLRPLVARYCRGRLGAVDRSYLSADDVAQEVCLAVLGALPNYRVQGRPFLAFVYGIAAHKVIDAHRAVTRGRSDPVAEVPDVVAAEAGPEQHALRSALSDQLRDLLEELPHKQRDILVLRIVVGLSAEETAQIVGASPGAVRVAQHRALARLRKSAPRHLVRDPI